MMTPRKTNSDEQVSCGAAEFLRFISDAGEIRYVFVKAPHDNSARALLGYYEPNEFDGIAEAIAPYDGKASGIYYALNPVQPECLARSKNSLRPTSSECSCQACDIAKRRLLLVDIDPVRGPDCSSTAYEKKTASLLARLVRRDLLQAGWPAPVVVDSGNGFHLLFRIDLPADDGGLVKNCLLALAERYDRDEVKIDTSVHDAPRLAKLPGTMACKGVSSADRPHRRSRVAHLPDQLAIVPTELLTRLAESIPEKPTPAKSPVSSAVASPDLIARARAYLEAMPPAISGRKGRNQFLNAACRMVDDFALGREQALTLLAQYNTRCEPPFSNREVADKLDSALAKVAMRGGPTGLKAGSTIAELPPSGLRFIGYVPDFGLVALEYVWASTSTPVPFGNMILRFSLWNRLHARALIPDVLMRQLVWGARHDKNWRARLAKKAKILGGVAPVKNNKVCSAERCMLYGTGVAHRHYTAYWKGYPVLDSFRPKKDINHIYGDSFNLYSDQHKELREKLQGNGVLFNVYWPAFILGGSPKVGWTWPQQLLVSGMVRELTRTKPRPGEVITGQIVKGRMVAASSQSTRSVPCPLLDPTQEYVAFAGNGKRKGRGYQIIGRTDKGWLHRSGYRFPPREPSRESHEKRREDMKPFLTDLAFLSQELGLVPVGLLNGQWKSIGQMMDCLQTGNGQDWLEACTLRIYAPSDWRARWRRYFSGKLGFAWIPETPEDSRVDAASGVVTGHGQSCSAHEIRVFLKKQGWTQRRLADEIAALTGIRCSSRRVERNLGTKGPNLAFVRDFALVQASTR
jgi:hypothetical protein